MKKSPAPDFAPDLAPAPAPEPVDAVPAPAPAPAADPGTAAQPQTAPPPGGGAGADALLGALAEADAHKAEAEKFRAEAAAAKAEAAEAKAETERIRAAKPFVPADAYLPQEAAQLADLGKTLAECQSEKAFWARKAKEGDDFEVGGKEYTAADALEISMGYARREGECAARREAISEGASRRFALRAAALQARAAQGAAARGAPPASAPPAPAAPQAPGQDAPARVPKTAEEARAWAAGEDW